MEQEDNVIVFHGKHLSLLNSSALWPAVFQEFVLCTNKDIEQIIKKHMSGDVKQAMYAIGKLATVYLMARRNVCLK